MTPEIITAALGGFFAVLGVFLTMRQRHQEVHQKENADTMNLLLRSLTEQRSQVEFYHKEVDDLRDEIERIKTAVSKCHTENDMLRLKIASLGGEYEDSDR